jgi:uncharacterized protein (DUF885 family)
MHELTQGHHLHLALQLENHDIPDFRRTGGAFFAFNEGLAGYASKLARELGGYDDPHDLVGRLLLNAMIYTRLVVGVGLNYDGLALNRASAFMRESTDISDAEIESELLRSSLDLPGKALAYGAGMTALPDSRRQVEAHQGVAFDLRRFHSEVVGHGALPLRVLEPHVLKILGLVSDGSPTARK